jgi:transposase
MRDYTLSKQEIAALEKEHGSLRDKHQADRVKAVAALGKGWSSVAIAEILLFDEKTSRNYFERYRQGGLAALLKGHYPGAEPKLEEHLQEHILPDAKSVIAYSDCQYGVRYTFGAVTDLRHRRGFSYKTPTHVPGKQDPVRQQAFLKKNLIGKSIL